MFGKHIGIDLGTANSMVWVKGKGVVIREPTVVAISTVTNRVVAVGEEARMMLGRTPGSIEVQRPLKDGVIADYLVTEAMLRYFIGKVMGRFRLFKPTVMIGVPAGVTSVEMRAVHDAALQAGAKAAIAIPEPLAAAIGAGLPIDTARGNMVVDIGGGTTEAAIISLNDIVISQSVRVGGNKIDEAIAAYIRRKYNLLVGDRTAEEIKIEIGSALPLEEELRMEVRGRDQVAGLPRTISVTSGEITEAIAEPVTAIVVAVKSLLERTPPELSSDVIDQGMVMTGGGSLLRNMDRLLTRETGVPCHLAEDPITCVVRGTGAALENYKILKDTLPHV